MSKILIIASDTGESAPGKVFSSYIDILRTTYEVDVISLSEISEFDNKKTIHPRIKKAIISLIGVDFFDYRNAKNFIDKNEFSKYKIIFTMMSANNYGALYIGYLIKKRNFKIKWINYCVDAIPAPEGWKLSSRYRAGLVKMIKKFLTLSDKIIFSNEDMLNYQLSLIGDDFSGETDILYTLPSIEPLFLQNSNNHVFKLLYTGGLYQERKVDHLLLAIDKLIEEGVLIEIDFIGTNHVNIPTDRLSKKTRSCINIYEYTNNLHGFYAKSDLLIDIDADIKNDVFISSKFFNYIMLNRRILCITNEGSPSRKLVKEKNIEEVFFSSHNTETIYIELKKIINLNNDYSHISRSTEFLIVKNNLFEFNK